MLGIIASWVWVVGTILQFGQAIKPCDIPKLWSTAGMTVASIGPLLLVRQSRIALTTGIHRSASRLYSLVTSQQRLPGNVHKWMLVAVVSQSTLNM
jgi:hypothetical protein